MMKNPEPRCATVPDRKLDYVLAALEHSQGVNFLELVISEVACRRGEFPAPSAISVAQWMYRWRTFRSLDVFLPVHARVNVQHIRRGKSLGE